MRTLNAHQLNQGNVLSLFIDNCMGYTGWLDASPWRHHATAEGFSVAGRVDVIDGLQCVGTWTAESYRVPALDGGPLTAQDKQLTVAVVCRLETTVSYARVIEKQWDTTHDAPYTGWNISTDNQLGFNPVLDVNGTQTSRYSGNLDQWYHLIGTWDGSFVDFWVDGESVGSPVAKSAAISYTDPDRELVIGGNEHNGEDFKGYFHSIRVWDRCLHRGEVDAEYRSYLGGYYDITKRPSSSVRISSATAAITGTITNSVDQTDIVNGGETIIITLTGDTWVAAGATFDAQRQNIINGLDSAQSEANGWDAEIKVNEDVSSVVRTSDTVVTITLDAAAAVNYSITADETITVTVPATALTSSASAVVGSPTFTIYNNPVAGSSSIYHHLQTMGAY